MKGKKFEVDNWVISKFIVEKLIPIIGTHPYPLDELQLMVASLYYLKPVVIFEWGTYIGKSARIFYETSRAFKLKSKIYSIDLPDNVPHPEHPGKERGRHVIKIKKGIVLLQGDGLMTSLNLYQKLRRPKKVFFYLDGDHEYHSVFKELSYIVKKIPTANILLHDTFYQTKESGHNLGPHRAIKAILERYPKKFYVISTRLGLPGMTLLYQRQLENR